MGFENQLVCPYYQPALEFNSLTINKLQFSFSFHEPLTKALLHSLPARPAAVVDRGNDLERLDPLDETLQLQKTAVFTVWDPCRENRGVIII